MSTTCCNIADVCSVCAELGIQLIHVKTFAQCKLYAKSKIRKEPNTLYVLENKEFILKLCAILHLDHCDALLTHSKLTHPIIWRHFSKAALRKMLQQQKNKDTSTKFTCSVCWEDIEIVDVCSCRQCGNKCCVLCKLKLTLNEEAIQCIFQGKVVVPFQCPQCRREYTCSIDNCYIHCVHRLDEFNPSQRQALLFIKKNDPKFRSRREVWEKGQEFIQLDQEMNRKFRKSRIQLQKGCTVKLHGLKKKEWNGRKAEIIGEKQVKNGVTRWPDQLKRKCKSKALLKDSNLKKA